MSRNRRPILTDVAETAGVSPATVDRVLNGRAGVKPATAQRVLEAAARLGYRPEGELGALLRPPTLKLVFLLPAGSNQYLQQLGRTIRDIAEEPGSADCRIRCFFIEGFNPRALAEALGRYGAEADGLAFMALDHPVVREAVARLADAGKPVVTLISDLSSSGRSAYVGLDNRAAGRTAAYLLGRFARRRPGDSTGGSTGGSVALIAGSRSYRAHEERQMGFLSLIEETLPDCRVTGTREGHDDPDENYRLTRRLLADLPDLVGLYNVGGSTDGIARALRDAGRSGEVVLIGHGLSPSTRALLVEDAIDALINQNPESLVRNSLAIFRNLRDRRPLLLGVPPVTLDIVLRENLP
ncbi:transcriptional regulator, LacI family [Tistlia consotensis]|uniref:Transcriptional regulator, LacI family n=1 Tax=Tistlia consotensis USBA 355 TaxID=560819 RepID=A0A1Y6BPZ1_9PROT|nr:LacI family DNA-binding transcriptional regulator [Tistlia consotensis]SMF13874.1 transcriptional regulator, LacI family [Tistlia consotensis USBA 355]SNR50090.1 transcriptional regulator, LacI family [Tistlia consotensis]